MTRSDLIRDALLEIGLIQANETVPAELEEIASQTLDFLLVSKATDLKNASRIKRIIFELEPGKGSYTLGPGGDFDMTRPVKIDFAVLHTDFANDSYVTSAIYPISQSDSTGQSFNGVRGFEAARAVDSVSVKFPTIMGELASSIIRVIQNFSEQVTGIYPSISGTLISSINRVTSNTGNESLNSSAAVTNMTLVTSIVRVTVDKFFDSDSVTARTPIIIGTLS